MQPTRRSSMSLSRVCLWLLSLGVCLVFLLEWCGRAAVGRRALSRVSLPCSRVSLSSLSAMDALWPRYQAKMEGQSLSQTAVKAFQYNFQKLISGQDLNIPEKDILPVHDIQTYDQLETEKSEYLKETLMLKLNGGLGTGMGLEKAKSLVNIKDGLNFLDFIAHQVKHMRAHFGEPLAFMLMNSFATSADTLEFLKKHPEIKTLGLPLEFQQNMAPKVTADGFAPAEWDEAPQCEWCPPGHGDLYPAIVGSGTLDLLLDKGYKYMFVSNSDNLGATMDVKLLTWFVESGAPFAMEVAARTDADKKGGHLARAKCGGGLLLRESAQCPEEDESDFQDVSKHRFFNTNNLWVNLAALKAAYTEYNGVLPLPVMKNAKTVDPRSKSSTKVLQLETAMGAAIQCFKGSQAILIPRTRFAPVKTTNDLLALMSDAYEITDDHRMVLRPERCGIPPNVKLDGRYKFVDQLSKLIPNGPPSLIACDKLVIEGNVEFAAGITLQGCVKIVNTSEEKKTLPVGTYSNETVEM